VELSSGKEVADIIPNIHEIKVCSGRGVIVTGPAPAGSGFDFFTRFFCPKFGVDEVMSYSFPKYTLEELRLLNIKLKNGTLSILVSNKYTDFVTASHDVTYSYLMNALFSCLSCPYSYDLFFSFRNMYLSQL